MWSDCRLGAYDLGATAYYALSPNAPFTYCLYVPPELDRTKDVHLIIAVHGSNRFVEAYRDAFAPLAEYANAIVLAPLFPIDPLGDGNANGYKYLQEQDIRYDLLVRQMMHRIAERYRVTFHKVCMFGFSGGAHFTHRFMMLHPEVLTAVSVVAPGSVTLIDETHDWWVGTRDIQARFGKPLNLDALRRVSVHLAVGGADLETWEITHRPGGRHWMEGANDAGTTRPERLASLRDNLQSLGLQVTFDIIPGVSHSFPQMVARSKTFFWRHLQA